MPRRQCYASIMGEAAADASPVPLPRRLLQLVADDVRGGLTTRLDAVIQSAHNARPQAESEQEEALVAEFTGLMFELVRARPDIALDVLRREDIGEQLDALLLREYEALDAMRKLAYHHLRKSIDVYGRVVQIYTSAAAEPGFDDLFAASLEASPVELQHIVHAEPAFRAAYAMLLAISVALDACEKDLDDFTHWAKLAVTHARRLERLLPGLAHEVEATTSRERVRRSWDGWDEREIESELTEWKKLVD
jgi:hypothetical protein